MTTNRERPYRGEKPAASVEQPRIMAWSCPECIGEIKTGRLDPRFGTDLPLSLELTDDGERLYIHCARHCRLLLDAPLYSIRTGADRMRERLGRSPACGHSVITCPHGCTAQGLAA